MKKILKRFFVIFFAFVLMSSCSKDKNEYSTKHTKQGIQQGSAIDIPKDMANVLLNNDHAHNNIKIKSKVNYDSVHKYSVSYPHYGIEKIDEAIVHFINEVIKEYKNDIKLNDTPSNELNIDFNIFHLSKQTSSIAFTVYQYTGGSNGNEMIHTFTFDLVEKKVLDLGDLFKKDSHYLKRISDLSFRELLKHPNLDKESYKIITRPDVETFQHFVLTEEYLTFYIDKYQVSGGYSGPQVIKISKDLLNDILKDEYKVKSTNKSLLKNENNMIEPIATLPPPKTSIDYKKKVIALTFDDGPTKGVTDLILKELKRYNGHATFFVLGNRVNYHSALLKQINKEGHQIGNHSWNHPQFTRLTDQQIKFQINKTQSEIRKIVGKSPTHLRPPYGAMNSKVRKASTLKIALWDVDSLDWKYRDKVKIESVFWKNKSLDGKNVLFHDLYKPSAHATIDIIRKLHKQGYQFVTVSELETVKYRRGENNMSQLKKGK